MKLKRVLYWIYIAYLIINIIYISIPFIMAFARIPPSPPFFSFVEYSLLSYRLINMTYFHMLLDLIVIIVVIRGYIKQNSGIRFFGFTLIVLFMNFIANLIWTFWGLAFFIV